MSSQGVWQLQSVILRYSESGHSSRGLRFYLRHLLDTFQRRYPHVEVKTQHEQYELPSAIFSYLDGSKYDISLKDLEARHIDEIMQFHCNSSGGMEYMKHGQSKVWTTNRSIQGVWRPTQESQMVALSWFRTKDSLCKGRKLTPRSLPKYSGKSLNLNCEAVKGIGRWGDETIFPRGFDQQYLKDIFTRPFINHELANIKHGKDIARGAPCNGKDNQS
ncbi:mitochondrial 39S ribosomal protein L43, related [Babesia divergens]|uniref:Large ribosomal subunit protein mL43 n=1 Tax=Babesia divergens TaxID=32595 RepID=A0AAD9LJB4_BABDI|nr:mitochondrial 39S ribosomal protein L43, related [Babesia divergens]